MVCVCWNLLQKRKLNKSLKQNQKRDKLKGQHNICSVPRATYIIPETIPGNPPDDRWQGDRPPAEPADTITVRQVDRMRTCPSVCTDYPLMVLPAPNAIKPDGGTKAQTQSIFSCANRSRCNKHHESSKSNARGDANA